MVWASEDTGFAATWPYVYGTCPLQSACTLISVFRHTNVTSNKNLLRPWGSVAPSGSAMGQAMLATRSGIDPAQKLASTWNWRFIFIISTTHSQGFPRPVTILCTIFTKFTPFLVQHTNIDIVRITGDHKIFIIFVTACYSFWSCGLSWHIKYMI